MKRVTRGLLPLLRIRRYESLAKQLRLEDDDDVVAAQRFHLRDLQRFPLFLVG